MSAQNTYSGFGGKNITAFENAAIWQGVHTSEWVGRRNVLIIGKITRKKTGRWLRKWQRLLLLPSFSGWILVLLYFQIIVGGGELMTSHTMTASSPSLNSWGDGAFWKVSFSVKRIIIGFGICTYKSYNRRKKKDTQDTRTVLVSSWGSVHNSTE